MSPVEAYLADLRAALGDRLPPAVHTARLREARAHVLASAAEVGGAEAVHRYGPARGVANAIVRIHRGYERATAWHLSLPLLTLLAFVAAFHLGGSRWLNRGELSLIWLNTERGLTVILVSIFAFRAFQTRRWLALPVVVAHFALILAIGASELALPRVWSVSELGSDGRLRERSLSRGEEARMEEISPRDLRAEVRHKLESLGGFVLFEAQAGMLLAVVNGIVIALGAASDRRKVRRA